MTIGWGDGGWGGSPSSGIDYDIARAQTSAFIAMIPSTLVLTPHSRAQKPSGGWAWDPQPDRDPQGMSIVEPKGNPQPTVTLDGIVRTVDFEVIGEWDAAIEVGDTFDYRGRSWEVVEVWIDNGYEKRALVSARG